MDKTATASSQRTCLACGKVLKGRSDKKFCDDYCRNNFNNQSKAPSTNFIRKIDAILHKNRKLLEELMPAGEEMTKTTKEKLLSLGFQFKYLTHTYTNKKGNVYFFCYEYGYLPLENGWVLIVKRLEKSVMPSE